MPNDSEQLEGLVALAKSAPTDKPKSFWYSEIRKHANRRRQPGQSIEQAVAKFIVDPDGAPLFRAMNKAKGAQVATGNNAGAAGDPVRQRGTDAENDGDETIHMQTLRGIATAIQTRHPELRLTKSSAMAIAIQTPQGKEAYEADRRARLRVA